MPYSFHSLLTLVLSLQDELVQSWHCPTSTMFPYLCWNTTLSLTFLCHNYCINHPLWGFIKRWYLWPLQYGTEILFFSTYRYTKKLLKAVSKSIRVTDFSCSTGFLSSDVSWVAPHFTGLYTSRNLLQNFSVSLVSTACCRLSVLTSRLPDFSLRVNCCKRHLASLYLPKLDMCWLIAWKLLLCHFQ